MADYVHNRLCTVPAAALGLKRCKQLLRQGRAGQDGYDLIGSEQRVEDFFTCHKKVLLRFGYLSCRRRANLPAAFHFTGLIQIINPLKNAFQITKNTQEKQVICTRNADKSAENPIDIVYPDESECRRSLYIMDRGE